MVRKITKTKRFSKENMAVLLREKQFLIDDFKDFKNELTNLSKEFGYENPAEFSETADILNVQTKEYNQELAYINGIIEKGGIEITRDTAKVDAVIERIAQRKANRHRETNKLINGDL